MAATPKMVQLLKALPEKEFRRFKVYLKSPFFNKNPKILRLLEARKSEGDNLEALQKKLFPKEPMSKQVFKNLLSTLLKHYERFLANLQLEEDEGLTKILAAEKAGQMGLNKVVLAVSPEIELEEIGQFSMMAIHLLPRGYIRQVNAHYNLKNYRMCFSKQVFEKKEKIVEVSNSLSYLFMIFSRLVFESNHKNCPKCLPSFLERLPDRFQMTDHPFVEIYQRHLLLSSYREEEDYFYLKKVFLQNLGKIHSQHTTNLSIVLGNYCQYRIENGVDNFYQEYLQIKEATLKHRIGDISNSAVRNFIILASNLQEFTAAHYVLEQFKENIDTDYYYSSLGIIDLYKGQFKMTINSLAQTSDEFKSKSFMYRQLSLISYFMLGELDYVQSIYEATRQFLNRNQSFVKSPAIQPTKTYLKHFHKILKLEKKKSILSKADYLSALATLKSEIEAVDKILSRNQLIFIIEQLEERVR